MVQSRSWRKGDRIGSKNSSPGAGRDRQELASMKSMWSGRAFAGSLLNFVSGSRLIEVLRNGYKQEGGTKPPFLQTEINLFPSFSFGLLRFGILILSAHRRSQINDRTH